MRASRNVRLWVIVLLSFPVLNASVCGTDVIDPEGEDFQLNIDMLNRDTEPIHLFGPGETFPCCRVEPSDERVIVLTMEKGESVDFEAGRNGDILGRVTCTCGEACERKGMESPPGFSGISWSATGVLSCLPGDW